MITLATFIGACVAWVLWWAKRQGVLKPVLIGASLPLVYFALLVLALLGWLP